MGIHLDKELTFFAKIEPRLIKEGHSGQYVAIHGHDTLVFGRNLAEVTKSLLTKFTTPPKPLLIRQILGAERHPLRMRSPRITEH